MRWRLTLWRKWGWRWWRSEKEEERTREEICVEEEGENGGKM